MTEFEFKEPKLLSEELRMVRQQVRRLVDDLIVPNGEAWEALQEVVHTCLQLHGGTGYIIGTPMERMARDSRTLAIGGGATEVMLEEVAKRL